MIQNQEKFASLYLYYMLLVLPTEKDTWLSDAFSGSSGPSELGLFIVGSSTFLTYKITLLK